MLPPKFSHGAAKQISHSTDGGAVLPLENVTPYLHATWKPVSYKGAKLFLKYGLLIITFQESEQLNKSSLEIAFQVRINQRGWNRSSSKLPSLLETWPCHVMLLSCILKETWHSAGVLLLSLMEGDRVWGDTLQKFLSTVAAFPFQLCEVLFVFFFLSQQILFNCHCSGHCRMQGTFLLQLSFCVLGSNSGYPETQIIAIFFDFHFPFRNIS